ncbi:MAG TPA: PepSY-like domain-containing protein [Leadbetterella sp.]|nr:PepSY-like domain-containing protein [Leadbetterella sp.]
MKNLKLLHGLGAIAIASMLSSCEKDQVSSSDFKQQDNVVTADVVEAKLKLVDLPSPIKTALDKEYVGYLFLEAKKTTTAAGVNIYSVKFLLKFIPYEIKFNADGQILESKKAGIPEYSLKETDLPADAVTYLKATYPTYTFVSAKKYEANKVVYYEVKIKTTANGTVELKFDATGKVILTSSNGLTTVSLKESELLPTITSYLKAKYNAYTVISAKKITKNGIQYYELKIKSGNNTYEIKFNANGVVTESSDPGSKSTAISPNTIPASILEYLKANYAGYSFVSGEKVEKAVVSFINIKIKLNGITYELKFDANGVFQSVSGSNKTSEIKIELAGLPVNAQTYLKTTFTQMTLISARKIIKNETTSYVVKLKSGQKSYTVTFDASGKMLSNKRS